MGTKRISADKSASVYECFPFIWPYNVLSPASVGRLLASRSGGGWNEQTRQRKILKTKEA